MVMRDRSLNLLEQKFSKLKNILGQANHRKNEPNIQFSQPSPFIQTVQNQEQPKL